MQNVTKIPFSDLSPFDIREGISIKYLYCRNHRGLLPQSPTPHPFLKKNPHFFPFYIFFSTFQDENSQNERYNERRYKFYFFFLFGNFLLRCEKNQ